jgi:hypothetical protein
MDSIDTNGDLELLAAFIDGRLSGEERARVVKLLAESDEALELFANALRDLQISDVKPDVKSDVNVVPIATARRWRRWKVVLPVAAAAALAVVLVPRLGGPGGNASLANQYATELTQDPRFAGSLRQGWEIRGWSVNRGGVPREAPGTSRAGSAAESRLAFRLGVRSVDLQVALRRADTALAAGLSGEILETLGAVQFLDPVAARYTELRSRLSSDPIARSIDRASEAERDLSGILGSPSFAFGQWVGAADLAAQAHDRTFFESRYGTRFIRSTMPAGSLVTEDSAALGSIDTSTAQKLDDRALDEVHAVLQMVIRRRG